MSRTRCMKGFTLMEALIAAAVLSVGLLALAKVTLTGVLNNTEARDAGAAMQLAHDKIASLRNFRTLAEYDALTGGGDSMTLTPVTYSRAWSLASVNGSVDYTRVTVTVSWSDAGGNNHSVQLISDIGRVSPIGAATAL